jgi:hypothetical protein
MLSVVPNYAALTSKLPILKCAPEGKSIPLRLIYIESLLPI